MFLACYTLVTYPFRKHLWIFPDFLGIGAQKPGTTWLYQNLAAHPQICMPPVKELHNLGHKPHPLPVRLVCRMNFLCKARGHLRRNLIATLKSQVDADLGWAMRYCLWRRTDEWYGALFQKIEGKISDEVYPGYVRVGQANVERVHRVRAFRAAHGSSTSPAALQAGVERGTVATTWPYSIPTSSGERVLIRILLR